MSTTMSQLKLIEELQDLGADTPDSVVFDDSKQANMYIKKWSHLKKTPRSKPNQYENDY